MPAPSFVPAIPEWIKERQGRFLTVIAGPNNSGKSLVLKHARQQLGQDAYMMGPARFYHVMHLATSLRDPTEKRNLANQFLNQLNSDQNQEQNLVDLGRVLLNLNDRQRGRLLEVCSALLECKLQILRVQSDNDLSPRYIDMDGQNVAIGSSGTRLLLTMLGMCMDERFTTILIDEPELGLGPKIQHAMMRFLCDEKSREELFPHLKALYLATHSHLFLNRSELTDNYVVTRAEPRDQFNIDRIRDLAQFHKLQFNLLGNTLESMFFPSALVVVEGKTDHKYLERLITGRFPNQRVTVLPARSGALKEEVHHLRAIFGDLTSSPMRSRIFVVADEVHQRGLRAEVEAMGLLTRNVVVWARNGIEHYYPPKVMSAIVNCDPARLPDLLIKDDTVTLNGVAKRKNELCDEVLARMQADDPVIEEVHEKLLTPLKEAIA